MQRLWRAGLSICDANLDDYASSDDLEDSDDQAHELATRWVADRDRSHCYVCEKRFHRVGRMRHHCRACGEVVCRSCTQYEQLSVPSLGMPLLGTPRASSSSSGGLGSSSASVNEMRLSQSSSVCSMSSSSSSSTRRSLMTGRVCRKCVDKKRYGSRRKSTMVVREHHQRDRVQQLPLRPRHYSEEVFTTQATGIVIDVEPCAVLGDDDDSDDCDGVPVLDVPSDEDDDKDDDVSDVTTITVGSPSTRSTIASRSDGSQPSLSCFDPDLLLDVNCATSARAPPPPPPVYMHATPSQQELHILERIRNLQHGLKRSHSAKHAPNSSWSSSYVPLTLRSSWTTQVSKSMGSSVASSSASTFLGSMRSSSSSSFLCPSISMSSEDANEELLSSRGTNVNCKVPSVVPPTPAMAQVEASIADQAYLLYCIQTERTKSQLRRQQSPQLA
ncbi:TPA: hypothetical protein N0F65_003438 [Lagenidium giganteum]|uniref:FYVE-type domain-containing protein n=1 Tax=Lagenidium giganteum TaxID=4803 RepID=A0AAV2YP52_9STRA|nr:TPA: hypothetical protein N0F65_003438 [Lagenidium giganteum]